MTALATCRLVFAYECKIRRGVIEGLFVERCNVRTPAFMVCMTMPTGVGSRILSDAVHALLIGDVGSHRLVTLQAEIVLCLGRKRDVAIGAVFFEFGMTFNQRAGHHEPLEWILRRSGHRHDQRG